MLLRASSEAEGDAANLNSLIGGTSAETSIDSQATASIVIDSGVRGGANLLAFAEAVVNHDDSAITDTRAAVTEELGEQAMIDSAAVIANFQRMVRIADATGIPLDEPVLMMTQGIRSDLGIDNFSAAQNSPTLSVVKRIAGRIMGPFAARLLKRMARKRAAP